MIPKVIHYCWFGSGTLPKLSKRCIASWKKYCPDYEIKRWDESNFDVNAIPYIREAYASKKYAFVSDYARFYILYREGGIYLDTDVELLRPIDDILSAGSFMGEESIGRCNPGLGMACEKGMPFVRQMLDYYATLSFDKEPRSHTIVTYTSAALVKHGYIESSVAQAVAGFTIYPPKYFCPINYVTKERVITPHTYSVHHYAASWVTPRMRAYEFCNRVLGIERTKHLASFIKRVLGKR